MAAEAELTEPVRGRRHRQAGLRSNGHLVIEAGRHSKAVVVLDHAGSGDHAGNVEVVVGDGAHLTVVSSSTGTTTPATSAQHDALVGRDAASGTSS